MHRITEFHGMLAVLCGVAAFSAAAAPEPAQVVRRLKQSGGDLLIRACRDQAIRNTEACQVVVKTCETDVLNAPVECRQASSTLGAVDPAHPTEIANPNTLPSEVRDAIRNCREEPSCTTLKDLKAKFDKPYQLLGAWCADRDLSSRSSRLSEAGERKIRQVCGAITAAAGGDTGLEQVSILSLSTLDQETARPQDKCSGFGLTVPFVRIRHIGGGAIDISGPVSAGIGAGYYSSFTCGPASTIGADFYAYSEGLNISEGRAQFGVAVGLGVTAFGVFRFGIGVGYDLYRQSLAADGSVNANGLFAGRHLGAPSISYMINLTLLAQTGSEQKKESAGQ